jgi:hypothetical protein
MWPQGTGSELKDSGAERGLCCAKFIGLRATEVSGGDDDSGWDEADRAMAQR